MHKFIQTHFFHYFTFPLPTKQKEGKLKFVLSSHFSILPPFFILPTFYSSNQTDPKCQIFGSLNFFFKMYQFNHSHLFRKTLLDNNKMVSRTGGARVGRGGAPAPPDSSQNFLGIVGQTLKQLQSDMEEKKFEKKKISIWLKVTKPLLLSCPTATCTYFTIFFILFYIIIYTIFTIYDTFHSILFLNDVRDITNFTTYVLEHSQQWS